MTVKLEKWLVLTLLVFLPSQLAFHWWPSWSLVSGVRVDYLSPTLYFTDGLILLLIVLGFGNRIYKFHLWWPIAMLLAVLNIKFALVPQIAIYYWLRGLELFLLGLYFFHRFTQVKVQIVAGLVVAMIWTSLLTLWQFVHQASINGWWHALGERNFNLGTPGIARIVLPNGAYLLRPYATFPHPNALAGFLVMGAALVWWLQPQVLKKYWEVGILLGLTSVATWSRSGLAVASLLVFPPLILGALLLPGNPTSLPVRMQLNTAALSQFFSHFGFGVGLGNFIPTLGTSFQPVHNILLLVLAETGVVVFALVFYRPTTWLVNLWRQRDWTGVKIVLGVLVLGMVDHYWLTLHQNQIFLTILLATVAVKSQHGQQSVHKL